MRNLHVERKVKIDPSFDAEQWDIYTTMEDAEAVAEQLNKRLKFYVNSGYDKSSVYEKMYETMQKYSGYGACDSEPIWFLNKVLSEIYKE
jgi:hypothetical protein